MVLPLLVRTLVAVCLFGMSLGQNAPIGYQPLYDRLSQPYDVVTDSSGSIYIADRTLNLAYKLSSSGSGSPLAVYNATGAAGGAVTHPDGLCLDNSNPPNVYLVDSDNSRVIKFNNAGVEQSVIASTAANPPLQYPWNCVVDSSNNLYISNTVGQGITKLNAAGTQAAFLNGTTLAFQYPNEIALDSASPPNVYVADASNNRIVKLNSVTGAQLQIFPMAVGSSPNGVAVDSKASVWATDTSNGRIVVFSASGNNLFNVTTSNPALNQPRGIWIDSNQNVFVADSGNFRIVKFYPAGSGWTGGNGGGISQPSNSQVGGYNVVSLFTSGPALSAPYDVALDSSNSIYVADHGNGRVIKLQSGTSATVQQTYTTTTPALLNPDGLCVDSGNNVWVIDGDNQRIVKFTNGGQVSSIITQNSTSPPLNQPWNCAVDSAGNVYVSNTLGQGINKIAPNGSQIAFLSKTTPALVDPNQVTLDSAGFVYVADSNNNRIVKMDPVTGLQLTQYLVPSGSYPNGVAVDGSGNVYATATTLNSIYIFYNNGTQQSVLAMGTDTLPLNQPRGLAVDGSGSIYVADSNNNRIVIFQKPKTGSAASVLHQSSFVMAAVLAAVSVVALLL